MRCELRLRGPACRRATSIHDLFPGTSRFASNPAGTKGYNPNVMRLQFDLKSNEKLERKALVAEYTVAKGIAECGR